MKMFIDGVASNLQAGDVASIHFFRNQSLLKFTRQNGSFSSLVNNDKLDTYTFATGKSEEIEQMLDLIAWAGNLEAVRIEDDGHVWKWRFDQQS